MVAASRNHPGQRTAPVSWRQAPQQPYARRRPERTSLYQVIARHLESWLAEHDQCGRPLRHHVEEEFRRYLTCGLLCFGFARTGVFERCVTGGGVTFHAARPLTASDLAAVTQRVRLRLVRWFRRKGFLSREAAADMLIWQHSGFSVDASVRISLADRDVPGYFQSLGHLLRFCARPAFTLDRLSVVPGTGNSPERVRYILPRHKRGNWVGPGRTRKSSRPGASGVIELTPFEFLDRLAAMIPPPRRHRHRYHGVFAPNHPLRPAVTALAIGNIGKQRDAKAGEHDGVSATAGSGCCGSAGTVDGKSCHHDTSRIAWAKLLARVGEEFPLSCPNCGGDIRLISFITDLGSIRKILTHLGEPLDPPHVSPARGPPVDWSELAQSQGAGEFEQPSPDDLPMIDIHHR